MDALRPGHAHRSSSDRLLNNYLDSQKSLTTSLLTLLSHSHSSTSSLLAYVTSSPGVIVPIRRAVRHAAFEGPLSQELMNNPDNHGHGYDEGQGGWASYIQTLDEFRKDLKQIHLLEEELSRVKRDREILVTRLIKTTKSRPTRSDLSAIASSYSQGGPQSSRASVLSMSSNGSATTKEGKRAGKLADAQAELLGCEEHLRSLEVRIENERNKVMMRGLEDRFRSMEVVGRMWVAQAKRGLTDLERLQDLPPDAFELDSNGSLAPSQSASQVAYEDSPHRGGGVPFPRHFGHEHGPGSITGSIAEEDENGSSGDEAPGGTLVMHENRPGSRASPAVPSKSRNGAATPSRPSPLGVPSVNERSRPLSSTIGGSQRDLHQGDDSDSDAPNPRAGGRRAASDVGGMGYRPPKNRQPLRRTFSDDNRRSPSRGGGRAGSDTSSIRGQKKKKGFFASIGRFFKGGSSSRRREGSIRSGRDSPPYGSSNKGGWHTRTDSNIKRASTLRGGSGRRGGDDSSSDEDDGGLISVTNNRNNTWAVDNNRDSRGSIKRSSTMPIASGLIPSKPVARSDLDMKRNSSQSTVTASAKQRSATPTAHKPLATSGSGTLSRSGTVKSTMSTATAKSAGTVKSTGTTKKKTRPNGSIARASLTAQQAAEGRNIMQLVDGSSPSMPDVPKAPKSQVTPQMELPKAPGSSLVPAAPLKSASPHPNGEVPTLGRSISRASSVKKVTKPDNDDSSPPLRPTTPSRLLSPPLKSALRPSSPIPSAPASPPQPPPPMFSISAPGPVQLTPEKEEKEEALVPPPNNKRNSFHSMTSGDGNSIYESAIEDEGGDDDEGGSSEDEDEQGYKVVENDKVARAGEIATGYGQDGGNDSDASDDTVDGRAQAGAHASAGARAGAATPTPTHSQGLNHHTSERAPAPAPIEVPRPPSSVGGSTVARRKSVRMAVPDSPVVEKAPEPLTTSTHSHSYQPTTLNNDNTEELDRAASPEPDANHERVHEQWSTRIGRMRDDTSDEDDIDPEYRKARRGLAKIDKKWEALSEKEKQRNAQAGAGAGGKLKKSNSTKSKGSVKSRGSRV
ncbi:hypothetical protein IAT40_002053 [Kwoniella sp. CBS 6097]